MTDGDVIVRVRGLRKRFGQNEVLKGIDLDLHTGEVIVLFGRSGSGKSTLLRCINFLEDPTEGTIEVGGMSLTGGHRTRRKREQIRRLRLGVGMVFQQFHLFPHMTAIENIMEGPRTVRRMPAAAAREIAEALLEKVGLADKRDAYPKHLSGGQAQRIAIARALAMAPEVVLFDEVTSALDPELVGEVLAVIRQLREEGMTMIVVTHEMAFAREVANAVTFMDAGAVVEQGPTETVLGNVSNLRLEQFLRRFRS